MLGILEPQGMSFDRSCNKFDEIGAGKLKNDYLCHIEKTKLKPL